MRCKAQTTAIAQLWRGFATPQSARSEVLRAARDLFSVAQLARFLPSCTSFCDRADQAGFKARTRCIAIAAAAVRVSTPSFS
jgi:hypothetical protein